MVGHCDTDGNGMINKQELKQCLIDAHNEVKWELARAKADVWGWKQLKKAAMKHFFKGKPNAEYTF